MTDKAPSPFSGLDKALLRSTPPRAVSMPDTDAAVQHPIAPAAAAPSKVKQANRKAPRARASADASADASMKASMLAREPEDVIESIRKTVKLPGKEVSFVRLTAAEKARLGDIVYTYKRQGKRTSETEINRIAVNYIMEDYTINGANSVLARVIDALLS